MDDLNFVMKQDSTFCQNSKLMMQIFQFKKFQDFVCADMNVIEGFFPTSSRLNWNFKLTFIGSTKPTKWFLKLKINFWYFMYILYEYQISSDLE